MRKPRICAVIVDMDIKGIREVEPLADLYEVRIDLIGDLWPKVVGGLKKPWLACNRREDEGGQWQGSEAQRIGELLQAAELGASIVDIELATQGLEEIVKRIKNRAECLVSFHDLDGTPSLNQLREIVGRELKAGADICKVVTTASNPEDNLLSLKLIREFPKTRILSFAMGPFSLSSRVLSPLVGGEFAYASIRRGKESADGQITASELRQIYEMMK